MFGHIPGKYLFTQINEDKLSIGAKQFYQIKKQTNRKKKWKILQTERSTDIRIRVQCNKLTINIGRRLLR